MKARRHLGMTLGLALLGMTPGVWSAPAAAPDLTAALAKAPPSVRLVLDNTQPLSQARGDRLPLFVLPISGTLRALTDAEASLMLAELAARGIGYTVPWNPNDREQSLAEGVRIAKLARAHGLPIAVDATACIDGFFDGSPATLHLDDHGQPFADLSFDPGRKMGCPFALADRVPVSRERLDFFLRGYERAGVAVDFVFADWEIDGPLEWNDAWSSSRRCVVCRKHLGEVNDFRVFQKEVRTIRSGLQRDVLARPVRAKFPKALVGNYGVYPNDGYRYWDDYYERLPDGAPFVSDQKARYREWVQEFPGCEYTMAMPVVYSWYPIYGWYDFTNPDYRWFYNGLLVGSNAGAHTPASTAIVTFVHRAVTAPPPNADKNVPTFSAEAYQELLWHLLLRGHDTFFLWCLPEELADEVRLVHQVYAESLAYSDFLARGEPQLFDTPRAAGSVLSAVRMGNRVLVRRADFAGGMKPQLLRVGGKELQIPSGKQGCQIFSID